MSNLLGELKEKITQLKCEIGNIQRCCIHNMKVGGMLQTTSVRHTAFGTAEAEKFESNRVNTYYCNPQTELSMVSFLDETKAFFCQ